MSAIPADGPDAVLARVALLLKVPVASGLVERSLAAHPRPSSLVALVDVGGQIGLDMKPVKANESALRDVALPAIAHFDPSQGGGFGIVESVQDDGFQVWDRAGGSRVIDRDTFNATWSGVVVLVGSGEASDDARYRRQRVADAIAGKMEPPAVAGGPGAPVLRAVVGALLVGLVMLGVAAQPSSIRIWVGLVAVLATVGLVVTIAMTVAIADYGGPFSPGICRRGRLVDCQSVLSSRFARLFGFPLSELGISFYASVLLALAIAAVGGTGALLVVTGAAFVASIPVAVVLIGVQIAMKRVCTLCLAVHAVNAAAGTVAWFVLFDATPPSAQIMRAGVLMTLLFCLVLFFVVPNFKRNEALARLSVTHGRMAISPFASLAQLTTEQPTGLVGSTCGIALGEPSSPDELVVFLHPACNQCEPVLREVRSLARTGNVTVVAALPPKDASERALCEAVIAIGLAGGPEDFVSAYGAAKKSFRELIATDPLPELLRELSLSRDGVVPAMTRAREIVGYSEAFAAEHVEGTPAVFFNSLPYRGPLSHLFALLTDHFDLIPRVSRHVPSPAPRT